jgi:hypothetical protein
MTNTNGFFCRGAWIDYSELTYDYDKYQDYLCCPEHHLCYCQKPSNYEIGTVINNATGLYDGLNYYFCKLEGADHPIKIKSYKDDPLPPHLQDIVARPRWCPLKETK